MKFEFSASFCRKHEIFEGCKLSSLQFTKLPIRNSGLMGLEENGIGVNQLIKQLRRTRRQGEANYVCHHRHIMCLLPPHQSCRNRGLTIKCDNSTTPTD